MDTAGTRLTTAEAAFVVGTPLPKFRKIVEKAPVRIEIADGGRRSFGVFHLVFFHAYSALKNDLTLSSQKALFEALLERGDKGTVRQVTFGRQTYDLSEHFDAVSGRLKELRALAKKVDASGTEPVIKGTDIEVHRIAALVEGGVSIEGVLRDYPSLDAEQVTAAHAYATAHPKVGRPYPKTTAKSAMRAVDLSLLDDPA